MTNKKTRYKLRYYWSICSLKAHFFSPEENFSLWKKMSWAAHGLPNNSATKKEKTKNSTLGEADRFNTLIRRKRMYPCV